MKTRTMMDIINVAACVNEERTRTKRNSSPKMQANEALAFFLEGNCRRFALLGSISRILTVILPFWHNLFSFKKKCRLKAFHRLIQSDILY